MTLNVCINCFTPLTGGVCPRCGFDNAAYMRNAQPHHLRPMTGLNGRYVVGRALGEGGFGITYSGFDKTLNCRVAIKEYFPAGAVGRDPATGTVSCSASPSQRMTFETGLDKCIKEAQSLAKLDDIDSVVRIRDYFRANGTAYIIMDFVDGMTLAKYAGRFEKTMSFKEAYGLVRPVMTALDRIHARGFIHRDVSPDNIMIEPSGKVTLLDFGAVKTVSDGGTATEHPIIKRGFSPNEMYSSYGKMGPWTDVYSACATIYYLITGRRPDEPADRLEGDRIFHALPPDVPQPVRAVLQKGLAVRQTDRFQTMGECISAFDGAFAPAGTRTRPSDVTVPLDPPRYPQTPQPPNIWKKVAVAAVVLLVAAIAVIIIKAVKPGPQPPETTTRVTEAAVYETTVRNDAVVYTTAASTTAASTTAARNTAAAPSTAAVKQYTLPAPVISRAVTTYGDVLGESNVNSARSFGADQAIDGYYNTCWCVNTNKTGGLDGEITIYLKQTSLVSGIKLINGNLFQPWEDIYKSNGQVRAARLTFSDGTSVSCSFDYNDASNPGAYETVRFNTPVKTDKIVFRVTGAYPGEKYSTNVCIGEIAVF